MLLNTTTSIVIIGESSALLIVMMIVMIMSAITSISIPTPISLNSEFVVSNLLSSVAGCSK